MNNPIKGWQDWRAVTQSLDGLSMELNDFLALYPDLTREQLARIAGCRVSTVNHWFSEGDTHKEHTEAHKLRFAIAHWLKSEPGVFRDLRQVMDELDPP